MIRVWNPHTRTGLQGPRGALYLLFSIYIVAQ